MPSLFAVQAVEYLKPKLTMDPTADPIYWQNRRELLKQQARSIGRRFLESAGQMQLALDMPSSIKKAVETAGEATELAVRKGMDLA